MKDYQVLDCSVGQWVDVKASTPIAAVLAASIQSIGLNSTRNQDVVVGEHAISCGMFTLPKGKGK